MKDKDKFTTYDEIHSQHRKRIKEKFLNSGLEGMHPHEILEFLLFFSVPREDTNPIAHTLIKEFESLSGVLDADLKELLKIKGIGEHSAILLKLIPQLCQKYEQDKLRQFKDCKNHKKTVEFLKAYLSLLNHEEFHLLCLTSDLKLLKHIRLFTGSVSSAAVNLRKLTEEILKHDTSCIIIAHNHPSKNAQPSLDDDEITISILRSLSFINIQLMDHIIIAGDKAFSYFATNKLNDIKDRYLNEKNSRVAECAESFINVYEEPDLEE